MTDTKSFHVGDLLSVTTGVLVSPSHMDGVYAVLSHLCGESLFTHVLPRAIDAMGPVLLEQHPWLEEAARSMPRFSAIPDTEVKPTIVRYLAMVATTYGETHAVASAPDRWTRRNPVEELADMIGPERVIVATADTDPAEIADLVQKLGGAS